MNTTSDEKKATEPRVIVVGEKANPHTPAAGGNKVNSKEQNGTKKYAKNPGFYTVPDDLKNKPAKQLALMIVQRERELGHVTHDVAPSKTAEQLKKDLDAMSEDELIAFYLDETPDPVATRKPVMNDERLQKLNRAFWNATRKLGKGQAAILRKDAEKVADLLEKRKAAQQTAK